MGSITMKNIAMQTYVLAQIGSKPNRMLKVLSSTANHTESFINPLAAVVESHSLTVQSTITLVKIPLDICGTPDSYGQTLYAVHKRSYKVKRTGVLR